MGEKIEILGQLSIGGFCFEVEANLGLPRIGGRDIHVQSDRVRLQMYESEFVQFLAKIIAAQSKLENGKAFGYANSAR